MKNSEIKARWDANYADRQNIQSVWEDIEELVLPYRGNFFEDVRTENAQDWEARERYDDTAVQDVRILSAAIHAALTSFSTKWFDHAFKDEDLEDDREANEWLEQASQITFQELQASDFPLEIAESYLDLTGFGTAIITEEPNEDEAGNYEGLNFGSIPLEEAAFDEDSRGRVHALYRRLKMTPIQMVDRFGEDMPETFKTKAKNPTASIEKHEVIFSVYRRKGVAKDIEAPVTPEKRPYGAKYILYDTTELLGEEGGYYEMPAFVVRWAKTNDSKWGNSPAMTALADIKSLNELQRLTLVQLGKVVAPPTIVTERGLLSDLDLDAEGLTLVKSLDDIREYQSNARFDVADLRADDLRRSIHRAFFVDQLELKESPAMTATEVQVRYELMQRLLGGVLGRMVVELLDPLITRTFSILLRAGRFPPIPESIQGREYKVEYIGPLPRAQKADAIASIQAWIGDIMSMAELFPEVLDIPDVDKIAKESAEYRGVSIELLRSDADIKRLRNDRAQRQAQQQQLEQENLAADTKGKTLKAVQ